jgi:predicted transcriptional regulator
MYAPLGDQVMADTRVTDPLISTEPPEEVDAQTAGAIGRGIRAAEEGHVVPAEQVRQLIHQWISSFSTPTQR